MALIDYTELEHVLAENDMRLDSLSATLAETNNELAALAARVAALEKPPAVPGVPDPLRGVWVQGTGNHETARIRIQTAANVGANAVFVFVGTGRAVTFDNTQQISNVNTLDSTIDEAKRYGMAVYPTLAAKFFWREAFPQQDIYGKLGINEHWLDFRDAGARALIAALCSDLAQYDIAGVCLDYIRWSRFWYPGSGLTPTPVTDTVRACQAALQGTGKTLVASVISIYDDSVYSALSYGQEWHRWAGDGILDWLSPMVYAGQWHLDRRMEEWPLLGFWPHLLGPSLSPCTSGDNTRPKTLAAWQLELDTLKKANARGLIAFDEALLVQYPAHAQLLREAWL
jgi:hypothetical protein